MTEVKTETTIATKHSHLLILLPSSVSLTSSLIRSKLVCSASAYGDAGGGGGATGCAVTALSTAFATASFSDVSSQTSPAYSNVLTSTLLLSFMSKYFWPCDASTLYFSVWTISWDFPTVTEFVFVIVILLCHFVNAKQQTSDTDVNLNWSHQSCLTSILLEATVIHSFWMVDKDFHGGEEHTWKKLP